MGQVSTPVTSPGSPTKEKALDGQKAGFFKTQLCIDYMKQHNLERHDYAQR